MITKFYVVRNYNGELRIFNEQPHKSYYDLNRWKSYDTECPYGLKIPDFPEAKNIEWDDTVPNLMVFTCGYNPKVQISEEQHYE